MKTIILIILCALMTPYVSVASAKEEVAKPAYQKFNNPTCPVMGSKINGKNFVVHNGVRYELCCKGCEKAFLKKPDKFLSKLPNKGKIVDGTNTTCPVMGGAVNKKVYTVYNGTKIYFCCPGCDKPFEKNPDKYLAKIKASADSGSGKPAKTQEKPVKNSEK